MNRLNVASRNTRNGGLCSDPTSYGSVNQPVQLERLVDKFAHLTSGNSPDEFIANFKQLAESVDGKAEIDHRLFSDEQTAATTWQALESCHLDSLLIDLRPDDDRTFDAHHHTVTCALNTMPGVMADKPDESDLQFELESSDRAQPPLTRERSWLDNVSEVKMMLDFRVLSQQDRTQLVRTPLTHLNLCDASVDDDYLQTIARMETLKSLSIQGNPEITSDGLRMLTHLESLVISEVDERHLPGLLSLKNLKRLELNLSFLSAEQEKTLRQDLKECEVLIQHSPAHELRPALAASRSGSIGNLSNSGSCGHDGDSHESTLSSRLAAASTFRA